MPYHPDLHHRRSIRLAGYDYSQAGAYYVTICTAGRDCIFGEVAGGEMRLNSFGAIVQREWRRLPLHYPTVSLDAFVVMPNHVHGVIFLGEPGRRNVKRRPLSEIVRGFKTWSARRINQRRDSTGSPVWQRDCYEHIIRDEDDLNRIRQYIVDNPVTWEEDAENPANGPSPPVGAGLIPDSR